MDQKFRRLLHLAHKSEYVSNPFVTELQAKQRIDMIDFENRKQDCNLREAQELKNKSHRSTER